MADLYKTKYCSKCNSLKSTLHFTKNKNSKDGLSIYCKKCYSFYYQKNKKKILKTVKQYYQKNREKKLKYQQIQNKNYRKTIKGHLKNVWINMLQRCNNPKHKRYHQYGGRGIEIKFSDFQSFYHYIVFILKIDPRHKCIDRINNNGNYEIDNIRFISKAESNRNRRFNIKRNKKGQFISCNS